MSKYKSGVAYRKILGHYEIDLASEILLSTETQSFLLVASEGQAEHKKYAQKKTNGPRLL